MGRDDQPRRRTFARDAALVLLAGLALFAIVYAVDRARGRIEAPGAKPTAPALAEAPASAPAPPLDPAGTRGAPGSQPGLTPEMLKALQASGTKGLPPELARALAASGPSGPTPAPPGDALGMWPADFPKPPGAQLQTQIALENRLSLMYESKQPVADTVAHYATAMPAQGWKQTERLVAKDGSRLRYEKQGRTATIAATTPRAGASMVALTIEVKDPPAAAARPASPKAMPAAAPPGPRP
jgi:hypothetical protein